MHTCLSLPHVARQRVVGAGLVVPQHSIPEHIAFEVHVTIATGASLPLLVVPELLLVVVPPLELPLEPPDEPPLELLLPSPLLFELLHPKMATAATDAMTPTACTIFMGIFLANPGVGGLTRPTP
jgi:hypothetical protein